MQDLNKEVPASLSVAKAANSKETIYSTLINHNNHQKLTITNQNENMKQKKADNAVTSSALQNSQPNGNSIIESVVFTYHKYKNNLNV